MGAYKKTILRVLAAMLGCLTLGVMLALADVPTADVQNGKTETSDTSSGAASANGGSFDFPIAGPVFPRNPVEVGSSASQDREQAALDPAPTGTPAPTPTSTLTPTQPAAPTAGQTETPGSTQPTPTPTPTLTPTAVPEGTETPVPGDAGEKTPVPGVSDQPTPTPGEATVSPAPEASPAPGPTGSPVSEPTNDPTLTPEITMTPEPTIDPATSSPIPLPIDDGGRDDGSEPNLGSEGSGRPMTHGAPVARLDWSNGVPRGEGDMPIPRLFQYNYNTQICKYNGIPRSVHTSGCNVTCLSMVIVYLTGNTEQSPELLLDWAYENGLYHGNGLGHAEMSRVAAKYGVGGHWIGKDKQAILRALDEGYPVIAHMGRGDFTNHGHYIVLRGVDENGRIRVNDPMSRARSNTTYSLDRIISQSRTSQPFMICQRD